MVSVQLTIKSKTFILRKSLGLDETLQKEISQSERDPRPPISRCKIIKREEVVSVTFDTRPPPIGKATGK
jgi:hypothetical protein